MELKMVDMPNATLADLKILRETMERSGASRPYKLLITPDMANGYARDFGMPVCPDILYGMKVCIYDSLTPVP